MSDYGVRPLNRLPPNAESLHYSSPTGQLCEHRQTHGDPIDNRKLYNNTVIWRCYCLGCLPAQKYKSASSGIRRSTTAF